MSTIDLNACFPPGRDGQRKPLPKQRQFLEAALDRRPGGPKYIRYSGGVGSGKTMIGVTTVIHWAVLEPGDYLIGRQYYPELTDTTYKAFLEVCPPELIAEHRIADKIIRLHNVKGSTSTIFFRALEEFDKLRSLNLNAFYIDEAAQVSEGAFMMLQGRLRGPAWRKGIVTQNPAGHDYLYRWFVRQDHIVNPEVKKLFLNIRAPSTENVHLPDGYIDTLVATWSDNRIKREIEGSDDSFDGQIYSEFDRSVHVVKPFRIPESWTRRIGIDHGYRNAAAWIYGAISPDGEVYVYKEYYEKEKLIEQICKDNRAIIGQDKIEQARMDPSTRAARGTTGKSDWDTYCEHLPNGFPLLMAANEVSQGIDRVKSYLKPDNRGKPRLYVFDTCANLLDEIAQYRWAERPVSQAGKANDKEAPVKHNDHAADALRYLIMTCPEATPKVVDRAALLREGSLERALYDDLQRAKKMNKSNDPFGGV